MYKDSMYFATSDASHTRREAYESIVIWRVETTAQCNSQILIKVQHNVLKQSSSPTIVSHVSWITRTLRVHNLLQNVHAQHGNVGPPGAVLLRDVAVAQAVHAHRPVHHAVHQGGGVAPHEPPLAARGQVLLNEGAWDGHQHGVQRDVCLGAGVLKDREMCKSVYGVLVMCVLRLTSSWLPHGVSIHNSGMTTMWYASETCGLFWLINNRKQVSIVGGRWVGGRIMAFHTKHPPLK